MSRRFNSIQPLRSQSIDRERISRKKWLIGLVIVGIIALAWFDGGEEPIRPIVQEVEVPEMGR